MTIVGPSIPSIPNIPNMPNIPVPGPLSQIGLFLQIAKELLPLVIDVCKIIMNRPENENAELIGLKAEKALEDGIKPDDFDSIGEYLDYLNEKIEIDKAKMDGLNELDHYKYQAIGSGLYLVGVNQKLNITLTPTFWQCIATLGLEVNDAVNVVQGLSKANFEDGGIIADYFKGDLQPGSREYRTIYNIIENMLNVKYPSLTDEEIEAKHQEFKNRLKEE